MVEFIGRTEEISVLKEALASNEAELVAVVGRRRVGKTFLIETSYNEEIIFQISGIQNAPMEEQLRNFTKRLDLSLGGKSERPKDWLDAFFLLESRLTPLLKGKEKKVLFFDELPWLAASKSSFLRAFSNFWNAWACRQNLVVVICGSSASWIVQKVVFDTGGLHNRVTKYIELQAFTLAETKAYLGSRNLNLDHYQIIQIYMAMGGIPHYLKEIKKGKSAIQNIDNICFSKTGLLRNEFSKLYPALFKNPEKHIAIIRALAGKRNGMTRSQVMAAAKTPNGGITTQTLEELEQSGFIRSFYPFGKKKKDKLFRLTDEYSLFYLYFIEQSTNEGVGTWQHLSQTQKFKTWSGYAYESICMKHVEQIKKALGIAGVYSKSGSFTKKGTVDEKGFQIDLLIDRNDQMINLIEVKYYNQAFYLTKEYAERLTKKLWDFRTTTKTKKQLTWTLVTTFGLKENEHSIGVIEQTLTLADLFL